MKKSGKMALTAAAAAGVGYVSGLLSAPRSGKRTRSKIAKSASKTKTDAEKQLKKLHSELNETIKDAEKQLTKAKSKANDELKQSINSAKETKQKARMILSALHDGDADDPDLKKMVVEANKARIHLSKFVKKSPPKKK